MDVFKINDDDDDDDEYGAQNFNSVHFFRQ